jgi:YbbR domain-containing protein
MHNIGYSRSFPCCWRLGCGGGGARSAIAEVEMNVPIEFRNLPDNLEIDSASFTEAQIRVRGPERVIHRLQSADVRAEIDLANVHRGNGLSI